jgi:hypothetical protein
MSLGTSLDRDYLNGILDEIKEKLTPAALAAKDAAESAKDAATNAAESVSTFNRNHLWLFGNVASPTPAPVPDVTTSSASEGATTEIPSNTGEMFDRVMDFIGIIRGPAPQILSMGTFLTISDAYITSISPRFSNVLDRDGFPMACKCSVTFTLGRYPIAEDVANWHSGSGNSNNARWHTKYNPNKKR